jgi:small-conductance mechanosensitive channel
MHLIFLGNTVEQWGMALIAAISSIALLLTVRHYVICKVKRLAERTATRLDDVAAVTLSSTYLFSILAVSLYLGTQFLMLPPARENLVDRIAFCAFLVQLAVWGDTALRTWRDQVRSNGDNGRRASSAVLCFVSRLTLWMVAALMILDNLGFNITTLVASLGIGGVAVALAVQNILGDLFASLSIMLDKPFEIGDFIIVGDVLGSVEHIGLKTTRVRGLGGEQVVFSNGDLLKSRIHNHKRMQSRRVAFILRVAYGTSEKQLCEIPAMVREIIGAEPRVDFERTHFMNYGEWSLDFEVVYHFKSPDYIAHMNAQQAIFLALYRRFEQEHIQFAHPMSIIRMAEPQPPPSARAPVAPVHNASRH